MRGKWILQNLLGAPPPEPPPGVEVNLEADPKAKKPNSLRERLELHRTQPVCASCHKIMDPIGFSLENFDLIGKWRDTDGGAPIDSSGTSCGRHAGEQCGRSAQGAAEPFRCVCHDDDGTTDDLRARPRRSNTPICRRCARSFGIREERLSFFVARCRRCEESGVSDEGEEGHRLHEPGIRQRRHMAFITKKHLITPHVPEGRRRLPGVALAGVHGSGRNASGADAGAARTRFGAIYVPHGATMYKWTPEKDGTDFEFSEILQPLEPFRKYVNVISDMSHPSAYGSGSATANHNRSAAAFLSGAHAMEGPRAVLGSHLDQVVAQKIGQDTPLPSIEMAIEGSTLTCDGLSCAYRNTISWQNETTPLPMQNSPQVVFERLFGDGSTDAEREVAAEPVGEPAGFRCRAKSAA